MLTCYLVYMHMKQAQFLKVGDRLLGYGRIKALSCDEGKGDLKYVHVCTPVTCLLFESIALVDVVE